MVTQPDGEVIITNDEATILDKNHVALPARGQDVGGRPRTSLPVTATSVDFFIHDSKVFGAWTCDSNRDDRSRRALRLRRKSPQ